MDKLFEHKTMAAHVVLYKNRLEFKLTGIFAKTETILLRNISNIKTAIGRNMEIVTNSGESITVPIYGKQAEELKTLIMSNL